MILKFKIQLYCFLNIRVVVFFKYLRIQGLYDEFFLKEKKKFFKDGVQLFKRLIRRKILRMGKKKNYGEIYGF